MSGTLIRASVAAGALLLWLGSSPAWPQEWALYRAPADLFGVDFPGEPTIRATTYRTEYGITLPGSVYAAKDEFGAYSVTVVDWRSAETQHAAAYKTCMAETGDLRGGENPGICSATRARSEIGGATLHAAAGFLKRGGSAVRHFSAYSASRVDGVRVELANADASQTIAMMLWHEGRLYIAEATAPKGAPPASAFPVSLIFIDAEGKGVRYADRYIPLYSVPKRMREAGVP
jgi:hypothetical protein